MAEDWFEIPWRDNELNKYLLRPSLFQKEGGADRVTSWIEVKKIVNILIPYVLVFHTSIFCKTATI